SPGHALVVEKSAIAAPLIFDSVASPDEFQLGMKSTDAGVLGEDVGDVALGVAAQDATAAHGIDPLALMTAFRSDQHGHSERPQQRPTSASHRPSFNDNIERAVEIQRPREE